MDDLASDIFGSNLDESSLRASEDRDDDRSEAGYVSGTENKRRRGFRSLLKGGANVQDRLLEK